MKAQTSLKELIEYIKSVEAEHAYGSETIWWGRFLDDYWHQYPGLPKWENELDGSEMVDIDFAEWWQSLYDILDDIESLDITEDEIDRLNDFSNDWDSWKIAAKEILEDHDVYGEKDD